MNRIKELRTEREWKQIDLAELLLVKRQAVSKWELGQVDLDTENIQKLCRIFDVTADYLLGFSTQRKAQISDADAAIVEAYHAADARDRDLVDRILAPYMEESKNAAAG